MVKDPTKKQHQICANLGKIAMETVARRCHDDTRLTLAFSPLNFFYQEQHYYLPPPTVLFYFSSI
jgi:hypothetical protein